MPKPKKPYDTRIVLHLKLILQRIVLHLQNIKIYVQKWYHNRGNWLYDRFATFLNNDPNFIIQNCIQVWSSMAKPSLVWFNLAFWYSNDLGVILGRT